MKKGWEEKFLVKEFSLKSGDNLPAKKQVEGPYPVYGGNGIAGYHNEYNITGDNILIGRVGALCGNIHHTNGKVWVTDNAFVVNKIATYWDINFLTLELKYLKLNQYASQTAQPVISNKSMKDVRLFLPPLSEQKEIVEYLDSSFAKIDKLKENAAKNLEEAKALFQSALKDALEPKEGWEEKAFDEFVVSNVVGLTRGKVEQGYDKKYPYFKMNNISNKNTLCWDDLISVDANIEEVAKFTLQEGDFLFNTRNSKEWVGKSTVYRNAPHPIMLYNNNIMRIRLKPIVNPVFMCYSFSADFTKNQLEKIKKGTTNVWAIYYRELAKIRIKYPPLSEQQSIVSFLDSLSEKVNTLQQNYSHICDECDALKQAILRQVFE